MPEQATILRAVVASPADVDRERSDLDQLVQEVNHDTARPRFVRLELWSWETDVHPCFHISGPQGPIDEALRIDTCDLLVGIFWYRFGTVGRDGQTGSEHEIRLACRARNTNEQAGPEIMLYFREDFPPPRLADGVAQYDKIREFKSEFSHKGLWRSYKGRTNFRTLLGSHLRLWLNRKINVLERVRMGKDFHDLQRLENEPPEISQAVPVAPVGNEDAFVEHALGTREFCELRGELGPDLARTFIAYLVRGRRDKAERHLQDCGLVDVRRTHLLRVAEEALRYSRQAPHRSEGAYI